MRPVIIGIVGGSSEPIPQRATQLAHDLSQYALTNGAVVLTGGMGGSRAIKDSAADGAKTGRRISIVKSTAQLIRFSTPRHLVVESGMRDARNVLNAFGSDALIALWGGAGTLTEVAFAAIAGKPIIFLESRSTLLGRINGMTRIANAAVATFGDERYSVSNLVAAVTPLLNTSESDAFSIESAIQRTLQAPRTADFPAIKNDLAFATQYHSAIEQFAESNGEATRPANSR